METLDIPPSGYYPGIRFVPDTGKFEITGISLPENVMDFYGPVIDWLERYEQEYVEQALREGRKELELKFMLDYYNSGTIRYLISILNKMKSCLDKGMNVTIRWYYDEDDEHLLDSGKELADLTQLPFTFESN